jgi:putative Mg2+ transporter-C (MgtC) family protein
MPHVVRELRLELLLQLVLAVLLGGIIGLERELNGKPAGLRTNILICLGAASFTSISLRIGGGHGDPGRVAAQILTGVGFIGAGTILHTRGSVTGLTSAATIWVVSAIGMQLGSSAYLEAIGTTLLVVLVLAGLRPAEAYVGRRLGKSHLVIHARPDPSPLEDLREIIGRTGLEILNVASRIENVDLVVEMELHGPKRLHDQALIALIHHPSVRTVSTGE